jgi:hypothetical protein
MYFHSLFFPSRYRSRQHLNFQVLVKWLSMPRDGEEEKQNYQTGNLNVAWTCICLERKGNGNT